METIVQSAWSRSKTLVKGLIIAFLVLLLQIPAYFVRELIEERSQRQKEAIAEVSSKWAGRQTVAGPVLVLPYWRTTIDQANMPIKTRDYAYFLPDELNITAKVTPHEKHRGIYKVMLYSSNIGMSGNFADIPIHRLNLSPEDIIWQEAMVKLPLSDNKGLNEECTIRWNDSTLMLLPQSEDQGAITNALQAELKLNGPEDLKRIEFSTTIKLNGSQQLLFTPTGRSTTVTTTSSWPHPSFTGDVLPQTTSLDKKGFTATWKSVAHKRNFPQFWKGNNYAFAPFIQTTTGSNDQVEFTRDRVTSVSGVNNLNMASFGTDLFVPVNGYQKTMRSIKYAALCILLTFASFFLIEVNNRKSVHPFQYGLIGLALILFYTLLLSFSEYISFDLSYAIASVCTIGLIGWFVKNLLSSFRLAAILSTILILLYVYVFTILQIQDYSLLLGSIGLFITLAVIMYYSRKIQW